MAAKRTPKTAPVTFRLQIVGPTEDVPLGLVGEGKDCDGRGRYYYRAAPTKGRAALVHQIGSETYLWKSSTKAKAGAADGPREPSTKTARGVKEEEAIRALVAIKSATPAPTGKGDLKGNWKGYVECTLSGPEVVLIRDISGYGRIVVIGKMHRTSTVVKDAKGQPKKDAKSGKIERRSSQSVKWGVATALGSRWLKKGEVAKAVNVGGYLNLKAAIDHGYKSLAALISGRCAPSIMQKSAASKKNETKTTKRVKQKDGTYKVVPKKATKTARIEASKKARATRIIEKGVSIPKAKKALIGKKILIKHGPLAGRFAKIVGIEPGANGKYGTKDGPQLVVVGIVKDGGKGRLAKTPKKTPMYVLRGGKSVSAYTAGKTVDKNWNAAFKVGVISYTPATKKAVSAAKRGAPAPKAKTSKAKGEPKAKVAFRGKKMASQAKIDGKYVVYGVTKGADGKKVGKEKHGLVTSLVPGMKGGKENWHPDVVKVHIDVAERGSAGKEMVCTQAKFIEHGGRPQRGNTSKPWREARAKADGVEAPKRTRTPRVKAAGAAASPGVGEALVGHVPAPSVFDTSAADLQAELDALGFN